MEPEDQRMWLEHPVTKQFLNDANQMIMDIRIAVGEGDALNVDDPNATAFSYNTAVSKANGIKEMLDYATDVKEEE